MNERVTQFASAARAFCVWSEGLSEIPTGDVSEAIRHLVNLYRLALELPTLDGDGDPPEISDSDWKSVYTRFQQLPIGNYGECFDPLVVPPEEPVIGDVADDLADIWRDLKGSLQLYDSGMIDGAVWNWRWGFYNHWGSHSVKALSALHAWMVQDSSDTA